jgi:hypothetical protein
MAFTHKFEIGEIVTLKSHPLFREYSKIIEFSAQVPPLMLVKEVFYEDDKKKKLFNEELGENYKIADLIKYTCICFNSIKSEFTEVTLYESFLKSYKDLKYYRKIGSDAEQKIIEDKDLISEVENYLKIDNYEFGKVVQFKTKKLELRKSYDVNLEKTTNFSFQTPDFVLSGIKNEIITDAYYSNGSPRRVSSKELYKVAWFNHFQQKFSEQYLPKEFFVVDIPFVTKNK